MIPQHFDEFSDPCELEQRWGISDELAQRLVSMSGNIPGGMTIFSGLRTEEHQNRLRESGRPTAVNEQSTHLACPATGADVRFTFGAANLEPQSQAQFGLAAQMAGLRWGGGGPVTARNIPVDWNHLDLGPRRGTQSTG